VVEVAFFCRIEATHSISKVCGLDMLQEQHLEHLTTSLLTL